MYDVHTKPYALQMIGILKTTGAKVLEIYYLDEELIPSEDKCEYAYEISGMAD